MLSLSHNMFFLISAHIVLYRYRKSGHHLGVKAVKMIAILNIPICKKSELARGSQSNTFRQRKSKYYFLYDPLYRSLYYRWVSFFVRFVMGIIYEHFSAIIGSNEFSIDMELIFGCPHPGYLTNKGKLPIFTQFFFQF